MTLEPDRRWSLTQPALDRLLHRLDGEPEAAARQYETLRRRLCAFFEVRGLLRSEDLAEETLDRVARRLEEGEDVKQLIAYVYGVARRVFREGVRRQAREQAGAVEAERARLGATPATEEAGVASRA
jgi:DNA-directed RNA polymerase specialized sigma24 family protein